MTVPSLVRDELLLPNERDFLLCLGVRLDRAVVRFTERLQPEEMRAIGVLLIELKQRAGGENPRIATLIRRWYVQAEEWFGSAEVDSWLGRRPQYPT